MARHSAVCSATILSGRRASTGPLTPAMQYEYTGPQFAVEGRAYVQANRPFDRAPVADETSLARQPFAVPSPFRFTHPEDTFEDAIRVDK